MRGVTGGVTHGINAEHVKHVQGMPTDTPSNLSNANEAKTSISIVKSLRDRRHAGAQLTFVPAARHVSQEDDHDFVLTDDDLLTDDYVLPEETLPPTQFAGNEIAKPNTFIPIKGGQRDRRYANVYEGQEPPQCLSRGVLLNRTFKRMDPGLAQVSQALIRMGIDGNQIVCRLRPFTPSAHVSEKVEDSRELMEIESYNRQLLDIYQGNWTADLQNTFAQSMKDVRREKPAPLSPVK